jgi:hypothetical protein
MEVLEVVLGFGIAFLARDAVFRKVPKKPCFK